MKNRILKFIFAIFLTSIIVSCSKDETNDVTPSKLSAFSVTASGTANNTDTANTITGTFQFTAYNVSDPTDSLVFSNSQFNLKREN